MSTLYQSSKDVPTEVLSARLNQLSHVVSSNRERIDAEFTMRIPAEVDRDADLVMSEAAVRLEALQAECEKLRKDAERIDWLEHQTKQSATGISFDHHRHVEDGRVLEHGYRFMRRHNITGFSYTLRAAIDSAMEGGQP